MPNSTSSLTVRPALLAIQKANSQVGRQSATMICSKHQDQVKGDSMELLTLTRTLSQKAWQMDMIANRACVL